MEAALSVVNRWLVAASGENERVMPNDVLMEHIGILLLSV